MSHHDDLSDEDLVAAIDEHEVDLDDDQAELVEVLMEQLDAGQPLNDYLRSAAEELLEELNGQGEDE